MGRRARPSWASQHQWLPNGKGSELGKEGTHVRVEVKGQDTASFFLFSHFGQGDHVCTACSCKSVCERVSIPKACVGFRVWV